MQEERLREQLMEGVGRIQAEERMIREMEDAEEFSITINTHFLTFICC